MPKRYTLLPTAEDVSNETSGFKPPPTHTEKVTDPKTIRKDFFWIAFPYLLNFIVFLTYTFYFFSHSAPSSQPTLTWPDIYDNLNPNKIVLKAGEEESQFHGRPTNQTRKAWANLLNVGIVSITPDEATRLPFVTAANTKEPDQFVVELNVFHQLHCLNMLRKQVWNPRQISWSRDEPVGWWEYHIDHCIEHLRMSLMCQGDTTPQRFVVDGNGKYSLPTRQQFQCVNFDTIWDWAKSRNTTGDVPGVVEGFERKSEKGFESILNGHEG